MAQEALAAARLEVDNGLAARAVSSAYYAMLNAVQAALSEEDRYAKTHAGLWSQFGETFVVTGRFDAGLANAARRSQRRREDADYAAVFATTAQAAEMVALAERFVAAVASMVEAGGG